jgi:hypothetical protein
MMNTTTGMPGAFIWFLFFATGGATLYYGAIISGMFKNSLMAYLRHYGEDEPIYPVCRLLAAASAFCLMTAIVMYHSVMPSSYLYRLFPPETFEVMALAGLVANLLIRRQNDLRQALPRWYFTLLHETSRQERRQLAFAWLRIPFRLRWRLNGDQASFYVWSELVRLTVIYGAYDPDSPWDHWM